MEAFLEILSGDILAELMLDGIDCGWDVGVDEKSLDVMSAITSSDFSAPHNNAFVPK